MESITVAVVEDDQGIRDTLVRLLEGAPGFRCLGAFSPGRPRCAFCRGAALLWPALPLAWLLSEFQM